MRANAREKHESGKKTHTQSHVVKVKEREKSNNNFLEHAVYVQDRSAYKQKDDTRAYTSPNLHIIRSTQRSRYGANNRYIPEKMLR